MGEPTAKMERIMRMDTVSLREGQVVLQWTIKLTADEFEDFKVWPDLVKRRTERHVITPEPPE